MLDLGKVPLLTCSQKEKEFTYEDLETCGTYLSSPQLSVEVSIACLDSHPEP